jgi:hypothetical protein
MKWRSLGSGLVLVQNAGAGSSVVGSGVGGVLTRVFPPGLVDGLIAGAGRTEQRHRALPARVMAYFAVGMGLYSEGSDKDVLAQLTDGHSEASGWAQKYPLPPKSAIFQTRRRLGSQPLAELFDRVVAKPGQAPTPGVWVGIGGCSQSTGPAWMWLKPPPTSSTSALWRTAVGTRADLLWRIRIDRAGPEPQDLEGLPTGPGWTSCSSGTPQPHATPHRCRVAL